jgi:HAMP domain-containing protein
MNCLDFRRQLNIDPQSAAAEFARHRQECARCAEALERALAFEGDLRHALLVPVPAQLADSILLAQATGEQRLRARRRRGAALVALAAAALLAIGIGVQTEASPLSRLAVKHLNKEAFILPMTQPIPDDEVRKAFAESGVNLAGVPAGISFVYCCPVGPYHSVHLVMPQHEGPMTVLYLTEDAVKQREEVTRDGWRVRSVPLAHGTLVLLAHDASHFDQVESAWRTALDKSA